MRIRIYSDQRGSMLDNPLSNADTGPILIHSDYAISEDPVQLTDSIRILPPFDEIPRRRRIRHHDDILRNESKVRVYLDSLVIILEYHLQNGPQ